MNSYIDVLLNGCDITVGNPSNNVCVCPLRKHYHQADGNVFQVSCSHPKLSSKDKSTGLLLPYIKNHNDVDSAVKDFVRIKKSLYE